MIELVPWWKTEWFLSTLYMAGATLGQFAHAIKKAHVDNDVDTMAQWFSGNKWRTAGAVIANLGATLTVVATGAPVNLTVLQCLIVSILSGLGADALVNKAPSTVWTPAEREQKRQEGP